MRTHQHAAGLPKGLTVAECAHGKASAGPATAAAIKSNADPTGANTQARSNGSGESTRRPSGEPGPGALPCLSATCQRAADCSAAPMMAAPVMSRAGSSVCQARTSSTKRLLAVLKGAYGSLPPGGQATMPSW